MSLTNISAMIFNIETFIEEGDTHEQSFEDCESEK